MNIHDITMVLKSIKAQFINIVISNYFISLSLCFPALEIPVYHNFN